MGREPGTEVRDHGGELALAALRPFGVDTLFTLSGGHVFPFYDAAVKRDPPTRIVDVRHEQTATFAAEGLARLTRRPGLAVLTAGPGVTNGMSAIVQARFNGSPVVVLGGRAPQGRWGAGSLQELDHVPLVASVTKLARTVTSVEEIPAVVHDAAVTALTPHRGPVFVDFPLDVVFAQGSAEVPGATVPVAAEPDPDLVAQVAAMVATAERPMLIAGGDVWWACAERELVAAVEHLRVPTFVNGQGRGCLPADHPLAASRTRALLKTEADLVVVVGTALDFRLSFGSFGDATVVHVVDSADGAAGHVDALTVAGDLRTVLAGLAAHTGPRADHAPWVTRVAGLEAAAADADRDLLAAAATPVLPTRVYGELAARLDRDAVVVCDGGDFVSYAGRHVPVHEPGCWLDSGPYGCLGTGMGYAMAARVAHPDRQVVALLGDGAAGFSLMDVDTLVRHGLPVVMVVGNNGIWGLEKHPMRMLYGYDVAADLQPGCRYDQVVAALGGAGETVSDPEDVGPALDRALAAGVPYLVNVLTDPVDAYPRSSNLA
ncbi:MAG TPA: acetolactate synthase [Acidimicrobiales bacterium]|nr:acetolactate synthase [Acidimicrobiales bacterium]